jgi:hypothetical protein
MPASGSSEVRLQTRLGAALLLYAFAGLGLFLLIAPWTPVWTQATYALLPVAVGRWVLSGWARGVATGLGALDLAIAAQVGVELWRQLREPRRGERLADLSPAGQQKKGGA